MVPTKYWLVKSNYYIYKRPGSKVIKYILHQPQGLGFDPRGYIFSGVRPFHE